MWVQHGHLTADVPGGFHDMPGTSAPRDVDSNGWHDNDEGHAGPADLVLTFP